MITSKKTDRRSFPSLKTFGSYNASRVRPKGFSSQPLKSTINQKTKIKTMKSVQITFGLLPLLSHAYASTTPPQVIFGQEDLTSGAKQEDVSRWNWKVSLASRQAEND